MKIEISEMLLKRFTAGQILSVLDIDGEIEYHKFEYNQEPKRISVIHLLEDNDKKYKYTKNHMVLHPINLEEIIKEGV